MNCNTCGEGAAFCIEGIAPEVNVRQAAASKGVIPNRLNCSGNIYDFGVAAGKGICYNGDHLFAINIRRNVICTIRRGLGNARNHNVVSGVLILGVKIVACPGSAVGIYHLCFRLFRCSGFFRLCRFFCSFCRQGCRRLLCGWCSRCCSWGSWRCRLFIQIL